MPLKTSFIVTNQDHFIQERPWPSRLFWIVLGIFWLVCYWAGGGRPLSTPDEARYVEIPREMLATHDWITPRLNGVKYFEKPILFYWMQALLLKVFGLQWESVFRFWNWFLGGVGIASLYAFLKRHTSIAVAQKSALILATSVLYNIFSLFVSLDMPLSLWMNLGLMAWYEAFHTPPSLKRRGWTACATLCWALGVLTKGLIAFLLPGLILVIWLTVTHSWVRIWPLYSLSNFFLFLGVTAPWHIIVAIKNPEFLYKYFIVEQWIRYHTSYHQRYQPIWFFIPVVTLGFFPWILGLGGRLQVLWEKVRSRDPFFLFLVTWGMTIFGFYSLSHSKLIPYILPIWMPFSAILALVIPDAVDQLNRRPLWIGLGIFGFVLTILWVVHPHCSDLETLRPIVQILSVTFGGLVGGFILFNRMTLVLTYCSAIILYGIYTEVPQLQRPSIKPLVQTLQTLRYPKERVVCLDDYLQDIPVYLNETITISGFQGELAFGTTVEDTSSKMITSEQFLNLLPQEPIWVFSQLNRYQAFVRSHPDRLFPVLSTPRYVLATNISNWKSR
jgi:4-amino-4-deoxy-L-arabinose transferase-like glycosyltransferase